MFRKILIANRGEIACRIAATCRQMGVATVAVYSDADAHAAHVAMADEAMRIGAAPVAESYLQGARILEAARATGAEAIHPGYGFLSENPDFAALVEEAGLRFIGPPAAAIRAMGLKDAAKALMESAGVPVVPGYHGAAQEPALLARNAQEIGYPVLIKARAGGGGKGMRRVDAPADFAEALASAQREAQAAFGDPAVLVEKYVTAPRHIEIQILADSHGHVVHLFERDCSLQRRHQKVIEEAPAPGMTEAVRKAMGAAAVEAARAIGYVGAGTVEFIADGSDGLRPGGFWFMEMNTRLQVEHPVTEAITGLDLVALQLRIASGAPLPFAQSDLRIDGHAFEARLYAEDVPHGFLPAAGRLSHLVFPPGAAFRNAPLRIDSGVQQGDVISPFYDPMIAKLVVHAPSRAEALTRLGAVLAGCELAGLTTNLGFLAALARHPGFVAGKVDTGLIARDLDQLVAPKPVSDLAIGVAAIAALGLLCGHRGLDPWDRLVGWRAWSEARHTVRLRSGEAELLRSVVVLGPDRYRIEEGERSFDLRIDCDAQGLRVVFCGQNRRISVIGSRAAVTVVLDGTDHVFALPDPLAVGGEADAESGVVLAPMPGLVRLVSVAPGAAVAKGDTLIVLEAMKMEHNLTAPRNGILVEIQAEVGQQVDAGAVLARLAPAERTGAEDSDG
ncbi:MAG: acetyl/propionyl/methylcrotonyl-CoA carboxylase subunit alpha [Pseudomonadota bacterium]